MAFVALQFEDNQIFVASSRVAGKRAQVQNLFSVQLEGDDAAVGEQLKSDLAKHNLSRADAILVVSRANVEMREVVVPPAPDNELPDMVRFIARSEFASLNENWLFDYVPLSDDPTASRTVLAAGLSPELDTQMRTIADAAGLKVKHIVLRPYACIDLVRPKLADGKCRLLVDPNGDQTDMTIVSGTDLLATRTVRIPESYDANQRSTNLLSEVRRTLASSRKMLGDRKVTGVMMYGDENKILAGNLSGQLDLEVDFIQPLELAPLASGVKAPEHQARYAALLGSLVQQSSSNPHAIDFVNPRKPIIKKADYSKWYLYGGLALAASLLFVFAGWLVLRNQGTQIAEWEEKVRVVEDQNNGEALGFEPVAQVLGEVGVIDKWKYSDFNWLEELHKYSKHSLTADEVIVDIFDGGLTKGATARILAKTRMGGEQQNKDLVIDLCKEHFEVEPPRTVKNPDDKEYPISADFRLSLVRDKGQILKAINKIAIERLREMNSVQ